MHVMFHVRKDVRDDTRFVFERHVFFFSDVIFNLNFFVLSCVTCRRDWRNNSIRPFASEKNFCASYTSDALGTDSVASSPSRMNTDGNSHMPANNPFSGLFVKKPFRVV